MRKKSHVLLAKYIANNVSENELQLHRKAFCLGSILPDLKPSFLTTKHEFFGTFESVQEKIRNLTVDCNIDSRNARVYWRQLGEVIHYVADYFTFPHNETYVGSLSDHCIYEKVLKNDMKSYIKSGQANNFASRDITFHSLEALFSYVKSEHAIYLSRERNVTEDIRFIIRICYQVVQGIVQLLNEKLSTVHTKMSLVVE